jgi:hypothetical protein
VKPVGSAPWPVNPAHVGAFGPFAGRNDHGGGMPPQAVLTPSADQPPEEVPGDDVPSEADDARSE